MIHPFVKSSIELRLAEISSMDQSRKANALNGAGFDLWVEDCKLNEKGTAYLATLQNGKEMELARVTSYCDKWDKDLLYWGLQVAKQHGSSAQAECRRIMEAAKMVGHEVHAYACARMLGLLEREDFGLFVGPLREDSIHCARLFDDWWEGCKHEYKVVATEFTVWSTIWKFAGTIDVLLWHIETCEYHLKDFKTTSNISAGYKLQAGAYQHCLTQIGRPAYVSSLVLLPKPGQGDHWTEHTLWTSIENSVSFQMAFMNLCGVVNSLSSAKRGKKKHGLPIAKVDNRSWDSFVDEPMSDEEIEKLWAFR